MAIIVKNILLQRWKIMSSSFKACSVKLFHFRTTTKKRCALHIWFHFINNCAYVTYEFSIALQHECIKSVYEPKPTGTPGITMFHRENVGKNFEEQNQIALYFKIPNEKHALGDSRYRIEPSKIVWVEIAIIMISRSLCHQLRIDSSLSHLDFMDCWRWGTSSANQIKYYQICVPFVCAIVVYADSWPPVDENLENENLLLLLKFFSLWNWLIWLCLHKAKTF